MNPVKTLSKKQVIQNIALDCANRILLQARVIKVKSVKKILIAVVGGIVLLIGIAMLVLPGPAIIVIPAGLAILATEFEFARRWLHRCNEYFERAKEKYRDRRKRKQAAKLLA